MDVQFRADPALLPQAVPGGVRFAFDAAPGTRSVALAGTFNSWAGDACMLERVTPTRWQTVLPVPAGRHLYKFVIDDRDWIVDPANPWISEDGQNNSCLTVDDTGAVLMRGWIARFGFDGLRFDDADITPCDFLDEIRAALAEVRPDIALIAQSYDEFHHLAACDLTYEGGTREMLRRCADDMADGAAFARYWHESTYSFPRGALRMRWLEDKEQGRASAFLGRAAHRPAAAVLLAMDGVPHILMGQEFDEPTWTGWTVLFDGWRLDWSAFDAGLADVQPLYASGWRRADATLAPHGWLIAAAKK